MSTVRSRRSATARSATTWGSIRRARGRASAWCPLSATPGRNCRGEGRGIDRLAEATDEDLEELDALGHETVDLGSDTDAKRVDYPDKARELGKGLRGDGTARNWNTVVRLAELAG